MRADLLAPPRVHSGVMIRQKADAELLADSIERFANGGLIATWCVIELLPFLKPYHWAAYAVDAGIPHPTALTIALAVQSYKNRIGYVGAGLPLEPCAFDAEGPTQPAIESRRVR